MFAIAVTAITSFKMIFFSKNYESFFRKIIIFLIKLVGERHCANLR